MKTSGLMLMLLALPVGAQMPPLPVSPVPVQSFSAPQTYGNALAWECSRMYGAVDTNVVGYRVYYAYAPADVTNSNARAIDVGNVTNAIITDLTNRTVHFSVTSYYADGTESLRTSFAGVVQEVVLRKFEQTNSVTIGTGWADARLFSAETNPVAPAAFTRLRIERTDQLRTYP